MEELYDVVIVGGGPAGLTAALYLARARYRVLVVEKSQFGGQIAITQEVVNYPGIVKTSGRALTDTMKRQAASFGAEFLMGEVTGFSQTGDIKTLETTRGKLRCYGLLLAIGARPRTVGFQGEDSHKGHGVAYCATCDGEFFTGRDIYVIGGGYAAAEESIFLTKFARHVTILMRKSDFSCAASLAEQAKNHEKITVLPNTVMESVSGEDGIQSLCYRNTLTGRRTEVTCPPGETLGVFVLAGYCPDTDWLKGKVDLDAQGYLVTDATGKTSAEGIYAAGDVCRKPLRQVVTATGDGALAATELEKYVAARRRNRSAVPAREAATPPAVSAPGADADDGLFTAEMRRELTQVFSRMASPLILKLYLDSRPASGELQDLVTRLAGMSPKLSVSLETRETSSQIAPCVALFRHDGQDTGLAFHGVPGGHEFTSFVLSLYHASGAGQPLDAETREALQRISQPVDLKILVTLSCSMCPDTVIAAQRLAAESSQITAHVYDIRHFPDLRERYKVMSVPCIVLNDSKITFGKKTMEQILGLIAP